MSRDPRVEKLQRLRTERITRASGSYYNTQTMADGNVRKGSHQSNAGRALLSLVLFVIIITVALYTASQYILHGYRPASPQADRVVTVNIPQGENGADLASLLHDKGLIANSTVFYWVYLRGAGINYQEGPHTLRTSMNMAEIAQAISTPAVIPVAKVRIDDGWRAEQVAQALADAHVASYADVMNEVQRGSFHYGFLSDRPPSATIEGYLFPDTYEFPQHEGAHEAISEILQNFDQKVASARNVVAQGKKRYGSFYKAVIMASIVQREAGTNHDAYLIASTLLNRLHDHTGQYPNLGVDATVQYAVGHAPNWWRDPTGNDFAAAAHSPFNTRVFPGLPPAPIAEPNLNSIEAAVDPPPTQYFSYHHNNGSRGKSIFCTFSDGVGCYNAPI